MEADRPAARWPPSWAELTAALLLILTFVGLSWTAQARASATFDEPIHMLAGHLHLRGEFAFNHEHPPLAKMLFALPAALAQAEVPEERATLFAGQFRQGWPAAASYLFRNRVDPARLLRGARAAALALAVALLVGVWAFARLGLGPTSAGVSLAACAFAPSLLGHGPLATLDVPLLTFLWGAVLFLSLWEDRGGLRWLVAAGIALGAAAATKHAVLLAGPGLLVWFVLRRETTFARIKEHRAKLALPLLAGLGVLLLCYRGDLSWYTSGLRDLFVGDWARQPSYLLGRVEAEGALSYYLVALAVKVPLPLLLLGLLGIGDGLRTQAGRKALSLPLLLAGSYLGVYSLTGLGLGLRYVLVVIPVLALGLGVLVRPGASRPRLRAGVVGCGLLWLVAGSLMSWPHYVAYFNLPARSAGEAGELVAESNLDWGQDLPELAELLREHGEVSSLYLAYFGASDPAAYGIEARLLPSLNVRAEPTSAPPPPAVDDHPAVAVSINHLLGLYVSPPGLYARLRGLPELGRAGKSIVLYDLSGEARPQLAALLFEASDLEALGRELARESPQRAEALTALRGTPRYKAQDGALRLGEVLRRAGLDAQAELELRRALQGSATGDARAEAHYELHLLLQGQGRAAAAKQAIAEGLAEPRLSADWRERLRAARRSAR